MENGNELYYDQAAYAADQPVYGADQPVYPAEQPVLYGADQPMYGADIPYYGAELPAAAAAEQTELPPEPEDSPYDDPVVRHILSLKDDKYRRRMLTYLNENARPNTDLHPALVLTALLVCFPVGLGMMYFGTRWGALAKTVITVFVLLMALALYEILVLGDILPTPSLIGTIAYIFGQLTAAPEAPPTA